MNLKNLKYLFFLLMTVCALSSCSETSDDESALEYANWQARNDQAFADTLAKAKAQVTAGNADWKVFCQWSLANQTSIVEGKTPPTYSDDNYIAVNVKENGNGTAVTPVYTDSVKVAYQGALMNGTVFDGFKGTYNSQTVEGTKFLVSGLIDGFTTALQNMKNIGDHWIVYIPYNLGYGSSTSNTSIPAYSMLRFEIVLKAVKKGDTWISK